MTAWWTDTSTTGNTITVARRRLLRCRLRLRPIRRRPGVANAAKREPSIGEQVESLRNWCTGRRPVHSFLKRSGLAAALTVSVAALVAPAPAAAQSAPAAAVVSVARTSTGQSVADFYKARKDAPLWLAPTSGDAAQQLIALLSTSNVDGFSPDRYQP